MFILSQVSPDAIEAYGKKFLYTYQEHFKNFEAASQQIVEDIYHHFRTSDDNSAFALVRIFRACQFDEIPAELHAHITPRNQSYLALMASTGHDPNWQTRHTSQNRKLIPIGENMSPMFQGVFHDLGIQWAKFENNPVPHGEMAQLAMTKYFYVPNASQSSYITDQAQFVEPYGIASVIALGSSFLSGAAYTLIAFAQEPISHETAGRFALLTPYISTLLAFFEQKKALWA